MKLTRGRLLYVAARATCAGLLSSSRMQDEGASGRIQAVSSSSRARGTAKRMRVGCCLILAFSVWATPCEAHVGGGIAVGPDGNVYCVHTKRSEVLRISPGGEVITIASGIVGEGADQREHFPLPHHLAMDGEGNVYVAGDAGDGLWRIEPNGKASRFWPPEFGWQSLKVGALGDPFTIDSENNVYLVNHLTVQGPNRDEDPQHAQILKVSMRMRIEVLAGGDLGYADGVKEAAQFGNLFKASLEMGPGGNLYVGEQYSVRVVTPEGVVSTLAGSATAGYVDGAGEEARFDSITGLAVTSEGVVWVTDAGNHRIRRIGADGVVRTVAGSGERASRDGPAGEASFVWPVGIAVDDAGSLYVMEQTASDSWGFSLRRVTPDGVVSTVVVIPE